MSPQENGERPPASFRTPSSSTAMQRGAQRNDLGPHPADGHAHEPREQRAAHSPDQHGQAQPLADGVCVEARRHADAFLEGPDGAMSGVEQEHHDQQRHHARWQAG